MKKKEKLPKEKLTLDNMKFKHWMGVFTAAIIIGSIVGKFL
jgi:hypothetical protein